MEGALVFDGEEIVFAWKSGIGVYTAFVELSTITLLALLALRSPSLNPSVGSSKEDESFLPPLSVVLVSRDVDGLPSPLTGVNLPLALDGGRAWNGLIRFHRDGCSMTKCWERVERV
jgi:hypothetical protein